MVKTVLGYLTINDFKKWRHWHARYLAKFKRNYFCISETKLDQIFLPANSSKVHTKLEQANTEINMRLG